MATLLHNNLAGTQSLGVNEKMSLGSPVVALVGTET